MIPYNITPRGISIIFEGKPYNILNDNPFYEEIKQAIFTGKSIDLKNFLSLKDAIQLHSQGKVVVYDDFVMYNGIRVHDYLAERIISHLKLGYPLTPLFNFTEKLMENPNQEIREDLFRWLENGDMPICENGNFIAYKRVKEDFTPHHKGPYGQDQSVGQTVEMPREECDPNRSNTCSTGLHFCSFNYLGGWGNTTDVLIILEINPMDVTAIPTDYNLSKGRTCKFKVIGVIPKEQEKDDVLSGTYVYDSDFAGDDYNSDYEEETEVEHQSDVMVIHGTTGKLYNLTEMYNEYKDGESYKSLSEAYGVHPETISKWFKKHGAELV